jgi:hypothetical protein
VTRRAVMALAFSCLLAVACSPAVAPRGRTVSLRMRGSPPSATVTVDDVLVGPLDVVSARGVALPRGPHRVSVEAPGYLPWDRVVDALDAPVVLDVRLAPTPD